MGSCNLHTVLLLVLTFQSASPIDASRADGLKVMNALEASAEVETVTESWGEAANKHEAEIESHSTVETEEAEIESQATVETEENDQGTEKEAEIQGHATAETDENDEGTEKADPKSDTEAAKEDGAAASEEAAKEDVAAAGGDDPASNDGAKEDDGVAVPYEKQEVTAECPAECWFPQCVRGGTANGGIPLVGKDQVPFLVAVQDDQKMGKCIKGSSPPSASNGSTKGLRWCGDGPDYLPPATSPGGEAAVDCRRCDPSFQPEEGAPDSTVVEGPKANLSPQKDEGVNPLERLCKGTAFQIERGLGRPGGDAQTLIVFGKVDGLNKVWVTNDCLDAAFDMNRVVKESSTGKIYAQMCTDSGNVGADNKLCEQNRIYLTSVKFVTNEDGSTTFKGSHKMVNPERGGQINQCNEADDGFLDYAGSLTKGENGKEQMAEFSFELTFNKDFTKTTSYGMGTLLVDSNEVTKLDVPQTTQWALVTCSPCMGYCFPKDMGIEVC